MNTHEMADAIGRAHGAALDTLTRALWGAHAAGEMSDDDASRLSEAIASRRRAQGGRGPLPGVQARRPPQRPPVRSAAIERRRRLAASSPLPPALAARFTTGELAVLRIVADEHRDRGACRICLDAIAARAGVSRSLAKAAIRQARRLGLVDVQERRRVGQPSLANVVRVVDRAWLAWITRGGGRNSPTTDTRVLERQVAAGGGLLRAAGKRSCSKGQTGVESVVKEGCGSLTPATAA